MYETDPVEDKVLSPGRRLFLKGALATAGLLVVDGWQSLDQQQDQPPQEDTPGTEENNLPDSGESDSPDQATANPLTEPISSYSERLEAIDSYSDTVKESMVVTGGIVGLTALMNNDLTKFYSGNSGTKDIIAEYKKARLKTASKVVVGAPVIEETLFRGIPALFGDREGMLPLRGIISTYLFGKAHQFSTRPKEYVEPGKSKNEIYLNHEKVPVPQYILGAFYWMVARRRGLSHSMVAHATNNAIAMVGIAAASRHKQEDR